MRVIVLDNTDFAGKCDLGMGEYHVVQTDQCGMLCAVCKSLVHRQKAPFSDGQRSDFLSAADH